MLTIFPETDKLFKENILSKYPTDGKDPAVLTARQNGELLGYVAIDITEAAVRIFEFHLSGVDSLDALKADEQELADSMIKAAASYGMNRFVFLMVSSYEPAYSLLAGFGFRQSDGKMQLDLSQMVKKCKGC